MNKPALAICLAMATAPVMAQGSTESRSWSGAALRYTPSSAGGCHVSVMEASTSSGQVMVSLRNGGRGNVNFTLSGELAGNGQRAIGTASARMSVGQSVRVALLRPYAGSLSGSVLTLRGAACSVLS